MMIIAIDGYEANSDERVGIGRFAYEIIWGLNRLLVRQSDPEIKVTVYLPGPALSDLPPSSQAWQYLIVGPKPLWTFIGLPLAIRSARPKPDIIFSPTHYVPRFTRQAKVVSIMDLSYLHFPQMFHAKDLYQLRVWTAYSVKVAKKIFTISQASKNDILKSYRIKPEKVKVVYPGLTMNKDLSTENSVVKKYQLPKNYILTVGTIQPRKNFVRLIEAFSRLPNGLISQYPGLTLVIVGKRGWLYEEIIAAPKKYGVDGRVKFLDYVPDNDLPPLYKNAVCFALPSLYEGFGLPVLEAMSCGCPVLVSKTSSLPEIAGKAGVYVEPEDIQSITSGLVKVIEEKTKPEGEQRIKFGLAQAKEFTWEKAAKQVLKTLEEVANQEKL